MKFVKVLAITLMSLLLTGCYTQLEYSQTMKKITDEKSSKEAGVYAWDGEEKEEQSARNSEQTKEEYAEYENEGEEYIPVYYKDYEYATKYGDVYNIENYFGNDWYGYDAYHPYSSFISYHSWPPFYYDRWHYHSFFGHSYHRPSFALSFSIGWGSRYFYHRYYDPFYDPYFDHYYGYGYYSPFAYNYRYFYGKSGYGHGYYPDKKARQDDNTRYGPRSIGTNRVATDSNRSRGDTNGRATAVTNRSSSEVRTRSSGTLRTRSSTDSRTSVQKKAKRDSNSSGTTRTRTRGSASSINNDSQSLDNTERTRDRTYPIVIDEKQLEQIRSRKNDSSGITNRSRLGSDREQKPTFFNRMKNFFNEGNSRILNSGNDRTVRSRSKMPSSNRSKINRNSSSNRSSVTKSKSSSSNSRSRGSNSSSRSRSGNSSSSDSDRSRGN